MRYILRFKTEGVCLSVEKLFFVQIYIFTYASIYLIIVNVSYKSFVILKSIWYIYLSRVRSFLKTVCGRRT